MPLNVVFGVVTALALARGRFPGRGIVQAIVDLPFAVSPVIVGVSLILLWGTGGWLGGVADAGIQVIFSLPGMVLATIFVTLPFVVREVEPVLQEIGDEQEEAAATLGASRAQTFWRITLPAIRWGLVYGVVLTVARALGEFGALLVVSGGVSGESQTLTLLVHARYIDDHNVFGAYAASTVLMALRARDPPAHDDPGPQTGARMISVQRRLQAVRRLRRARRRLARGARGLADGAARAQRLGQVDAAADHRRPRARPTPAPS